MLLNFVGCYVYVHIVVLFQQNVSFCYYSTLCDSNLTSFVKITQKVAKSFYHISVAKEL